MLNAGIPLLNSPDDRDHGLSTRQAFCVTINYVIGTGIFTLPLAFTRSGSVFGSLLLLLSAFFSYISLTFVIETISRCDALSRKGDESEDSADYSISSVSWEFSRIADLVHSVRAKQVVQLLMCLYCYGALWSYSSVFSSSVVNLFFESVFGEMCDIYNNPSVSCSRGYLVSLTVFGVIVVVLSLLDLEEQATIQVALSLYRFAAFGLMIGTIVVSILFAPPPWFPGSQPSQAMSMIPAWNWTGYVILPSSAVALSMHANFPDVVQSLKSRQPGSVKAIASSVFIVVTTLYLMVGLICALFFGDRAEALITLNWKSYTGPSFDGEHTAVYAYIIRTMILAFPILDMLSVYPLVAVTLSGNLMESVPEEVSLQYSQVRIKKSLRLVSALPPLIFGAVASNLEFIFKFIGFIAFFMELFIPCFLLLCARHRCSKRFGPLPSTPYASLYNGNWYVYLTISFGIVAVALDIFDMSL